MQNLSDTHRLVAAGTLVVLGGVIIIGGVVRIGNLFTEPFNLPLINTEEDGSVEERERVALSEKDTDDDGLSDYDELYVYSTSPYLRDSDSDGTSDREEIERGDDPNCPQGQNCYGALLEVEGETSFTTIPSTQEQRVNADVNVSGLLELLPEDPSPDDIRELLREAGFEEEVISQFTDDELIEVYQQTLNEFRS